MPLALLCKQARALLGALTSNSARSPSKVTIDAVLGVQLPRSDLPTVLGSRRQARGKATNYAGIDKAQALAGSQSARFYVAPEVLAKAAEGAVFKLSKEETRHALRVLRLREGDLVEVCDGKGRLVLARIGGLTHANLAFVEATAPPRQVPWTQPKWEVVAAVGGLKGTRDDWLVEKACELGAWSFRPLLTDRARTLGRQAGRHKVKVINAAAISDEEQEETPAEVADVRQMDRWRRLATAAAKQSLRAHTMHILTPVPMAALVPQLEAAPLAFVAAAGGPPLPDVLSQARQQLLDACKPSSKPVLLIIGPEGDLTGEELAALMGAGAAPVGLGQHRLRVETAAMALLGCAALHTDSLSHREAS